MKKSIAFFLVCLITLNLFGCAKQQSDAEGTVSNTTSSETVSQGELTAGVVDELKVGICKEATPRRLSSESGAFGRMNYNAFCAGTWMVRDEKNQIQPNLMTDWEILDDGNLIRATFATDQGITWHDGVPFTIDDVIFTIDLMNNTLKSGYLSKITSVDKVNETTLDLHIADGASYFTLGNSAVFVRMYPKHIWENVEDPAKYNGEDAVIGCGPYKLVKADEEAQILYYEAVADTYMNRPLTVHSVTVRCYDSQDSLVMGLCTGEVDAMFDYSNPISPTMLPAISGVKNLDIGKGTNMGLFEILFGFNKQPTDNLEFRKAVRYSLDYQLLATTIGGEDGMIPGEGIISPAGIAYDSTLPKLVQDQKKAKEILDAAGYVDVNGDGYREKPDGSTMDVLVTPQNNATKQALYQRIAEIIISNLNEIGVKCSLDEESIRNADHEKQLRDEGSYEIYICYATQGVSFYKTPFLYMFNDDLSMWGTCNLEDFDKAYNDMLNAQDAEEYEVCVKNLQKIASKDVVGIALCWDTAYYPYRTDKYEGWTNYPGWGVINSETWYNLHPIA